MKQRLFLTACIAMGIFANAHAGPFSDDLYIKETR